MADLFSNVQEPRVKTYLTEKYIYYKQVLDRIKFAGVFLLVITTALALSVALSIHEWNQMNTAQCDNMTDCVVLQIDPDPICNFTKQFNLPGEYKLSVCSSDRLDVRKYFNNQSSAHGININRKQFDLAVILL